MPKAPRDEDPPNTPSKHSSPGRLSQSDPAADAPSRNRPPIVLIIVVLLLLTEFVVLRLTGIIGPSAHSSQAAYP
jgi:hypothetical protein